MGEAGVDAGGVAREWFQLVSEQLFNPAFALFQYSSINQMCMQINPSSGVANDEHLQFFHFAGRLLAKALFDGQLISAHLVSGIIYLKYD
jgi:HECT-domain (ubiquitin-transferase)